MTDLLTRPEPLYRQICALIEKRILSGELKAGDRLLPTKALAKEFGVTLQTAQQAASLLTKRGLVERTPGRGSFISDRIHSRTIGIVCGFNIFGSTTYLYFQCLYACLCTELKKRGWNVSLYFPLDSSEPEQMFSELGQELSNGRLRGVIPLCRSHALNTWLNEQTGVVWEDPNEIPKEQEEDLQGLDAYRGVSYLLERGYRRIAVIEHSKNTPVGKAARTRAAVKQAYLDQGLALDLQAFIYDGDAASHANGIHMMRDALDGEGDATEAVLILNDMACMGGIFELLTRKLDIPGDIAVMGVSNQGIEIPSPVELTRIEHDTRSEAQYLIEGLLALIEGRAAERVESRAKLIIGKSCGE